MLRVIATLRKNAEKGCPMRTLTSVFVAAAFVSAGCGGGGESQAIREESAAIEDAPEPADLDGCSLVTEEEVSAALGSQVGEGEDQGLAGCGWQAASGARVSLHVYAGPLLAAGTCDSQKSLVSGREEEVAGLGETALWGTSGDLVVCSRAAVLKIDVDETPDPPERDRETAIAVARAALGRI
jgi:hypothetical protein